MNIRISTVAAAVAAILLASCASKKALMTGNDGNSTAVSSSQKTQNHRQNASTPQSGKLAFVQKVAGNAVYAKNITGKMSFRLQAGGKDITLPGAVRMRKDEVIRLQVFIPLLGSEIGRIEFTPTYVLVIDRMHKEYIKAGYDQVSFLRDNGITFYSLQSLFWNQLFLPGKKSVTASDMDSFGTIIPTTGTEAQVGFTSSNMSYTWNADKTSGRIDGAEITYDSRTHGKSTLKWKYGDFRSVGVKMFPASQSFTFTTNATKTRSTATATINMNDVKTESDWDATTTVSTRYKKVEAADIIKKIINFQ